MKTVTHRTLDGGTFDALIPENDADLRWLEEQGLLKETGGIGDPGRLEDDGGDEDEP